MMIPRRSYETRAEILTAEVISDKCPDVIFDRIFSQLVEGRRTHSSMMDDLFHRLSIEHQHGYPTS